ncbi:phage portal protein [Amycolatopsis sp. H20-H5]|uniref:phage portal protein n=1 Tax=Amycolatopsis sp. H20-H5 TaxID=3046309 RepID=UPI002DBD1236|nr:phage portal protein [Amycolatopsis sp. H20-H5]MEC3977891.1 phage portal protein [Amycolatopsis sp. H20-H5]
MSERMSVWSAWYSGDPDELSAVYEGIGRRNVRHPNLRPSQMRGGLVGTLARWFWGQPVPIGEKRTKLHLPVASDIAATSADLLFSEPPKFTVADTATQDVLNELVDDGVHAGLLEGAEVSAALGGVYLKVCWDRELMNRPWLAAMHADAAVPEWTWNKLAAVTFWRVLHEDANTIVRHLERHEPGRILHGVYEGGHHNLGRPAPLADYPETAGIADALDGGEGDTILTGIDQLTAVYVPNMRPNRLWRNNPAAAYLGRSDYAGVEPFMDSLDEIYTSWMRDIRLAKARLLVPDTYLTSRGPGRGALFDPDRELYEALNVLPGEGDMQIKPQQFEIRIEEHRASVEHWLGKIVGGAGYSAGTFGEVTDGAPITATEVRARERKTYRTRAKKIVYFRPPLGEIIEALLGVYAIQFGAQVTPERPDIAFVEAVNEDPKILAETANLLHQAEAASTETLVRLMHRDWDDPQVDAEVERILDQQGASNPDPVELVRAAAAHGALPDPGTTDEKPPDDPEQ